MQAVCLPQRDKRGQAVEHGAPLMSDNHSVNVCKMAFNSSWLSCHPNNALEEDKTSESSWTSFLPFVFSKAHLMLALILLHLLETRGTPIHHSKGYSITWCWNRHLPNGNIFLDLYRCLITNYRNDLWPKRDTLLSRDGAVGGKEAFVHKKVRIFFFF